MKLFMIIICLIVSFASLWGGSYLYFEVFSYQDWQRMPAMITALVVFFVALVLAGMNADDLIN